MAQHDYVIDNQTAPNFRADLNSALSAIVTMNSAGTAPSTTYGNMFWYDSSANILKMRSEADDAWIDLFALDQVTKAVLFDPDDIDGATTLGINVLTSATPQDARNFLVTATRPEIAVGAGQWRAIIAGAGVALVLPDNGTWAYFYNIYAAGGENITAAAGVAAGGTTISGTNDVKQGFAWRING